MKKLGAAVLLAAVITGAGVAVPASAAPLSAAGSDAVVKQSTGVSVFGIWPKSD
ncbi:hypothetical protein [Arthrobacter sp. zg-Y238]|uniref:hypothetical protein n=1 Tax=Arthrobacter sp. zg-Y238 TaxID=2964614 RepID=UPI0021064BAB|nr:hypothetical protein [Arthrobacter sp. zg-Y238]MCQ1954416.1 hypothetical protein [Arthrobacter sp. zg-Y238]